MYLTTKNRKTMKFPCIALLAVGLLAGVMVQAQTVDDIVNKHIDALGGKDKLNSIKTIYMESDVDFQGNIAPSKTTIVNGKAYRNDVDFGGQNITRVAAPGGGWGINPFGGQTTAAATPADQANAEVFEYQLGGLLQDYATKGYKVELVGREDVNGVSAYKLHATTTGGADVTYYIDPNTYYILKYVYKVSFNGQQVDITRAFSKYEKVEGFAVPMTTELTLPGFSLTINNKKVELNKEVDMKIFDMPK
jgi:hypothetical protein